jgi:hypothetical protein
MTVEKEKFGLNNRPGTVFFMGGNVIYDFFVTAGITVMAAVFANYIGLWLRTVKKDVIVFLEEWIKREKLFNKIVQAIFIGCIAAVVLAVIYGAHF